MSITKRQHYIPRSVIKNFSIDNRFVFECQTTHIPKYYKTNINNAMCEKFIYEHSLVETNTVEKFFASTIDASLSYFHKEINCLLDSEKLFSAKRLIPKYIDNILRCYYRSGAMLEEYNIAFKKQKGEIILHILADTPNRYIQNLSHTILHDYKFSVVKNEDFGFILGDSYLTTTALGIKSRFSDFSNRQIGLKETMLILPISTKYCLIFYHGDKPNYISRDSINYLTDEECLNINLAIYHASYNKVLCSQDKVFPILVEKIFANNINQSPIKAIMKYSSGKTEGYVFKKEAFFYKRDYEIMQSVNELNFAQDINLKPFDLCHCGSELLYKNCCREKDQILKRIFLSFQDEFINEGVLIKPNSYFEKSIRLPKNEYQDEFDSIENLVKKTQNE